MTMAGLFFERRAEHSQTDQGKTRAVDPRG